MIERTLGIATSNLHRREPAVHRRTRVERHHPQNVHAPDRTRRLQGAEIEPSVALLGDALRFS
jgi:hypothetical protein